MDTELNETDVAIVGLGPAGATLANLLGLAGLNVLVFEREKEIYPLPRAIHFDGEIMRVFQSIALKEEITAISRTGLKGMHFVNAENKTLLVRGGTGLKGPHGCANNYYFHQPHLEKILRLGLKRFSNVKTYLGQEVVDIIQKNGHCEIEVYDRKNHRIQQYKAAYVIGCDGAKSFVRKKIKSQSIDLGLEQPWLVFDIILNDELASLPDHTVQICDPSRPMTYCYVTQKRRRFEIMLLPGDNKDTLIESDNLWKLVSKWIRPEQANIERAAIYTFHSLINEKWRDERLIILGDSAHQTPPFLGQGMCACIRDASNLAWKLLMVIKDEVANKLLDSYETERSPHVRSFIELAVKLGSIIQTTDPAEAKKRDQELLSNPNNIFQFPSPKLGQGFSAGSDPLVNTIFPQPELKSGLLMDDQVGNNFVLICKNKTLLQDILESNIENAKYLKLNTTSFKTLIAAEHPNVDQWLNERNIALVLIRPDRYIAAASKSSKEMIGHLLELNESLQN